VTYLSIALSTTLLHALFDNLDTVRSLSYWLKQFEYFSIFLITVSWVRTEADRRFMLRLFVAMGAVNLIWVAAQSIGGFIRPVTTLGLGSELSSTYYGAYGPGLIGDASPLSTGVFFLAQVLLALSMATALPNRASVLALVGAGAFAIPLFLSQSRTSILGCILGTAAIAVIGRRRLRTAWAFASMVAAATVFLALAPATQFDRLSTTEAIQQSLNFRVDQVWLPVLEDATVAKITIGDGLGSLGAIPGSPTEAHNYYLRVLVETGIFGLLAFVWLLIAVLVMGSRGLRVAITAHDRALSLTSIALTLAFVFGAVVQDIFLPVIPNEVMWLLAGIASAVYVWSPKRDVEPTTLASLTRSSAMPGWSRPEVRPVMGTGQNTLSDPSGPRTTTT
jgi:hypothetical protein